MILTLSRRSCKRISGAVSIKMLPWSVLTTTEQRVRWFFGLDELQTGQSQPSIGTPADEPVPRKVMKRLAMPVLDTNGMNSVLLTVPATLEQHLRDLHGVGGG